MGKNVANVRVTSVWCGMKRRLMIAALMHEPQLLLILDEPTAGVDIELRCLDVEFLKEIQREAGITIILTTHYLEEARKCCVATSASLIGSWLRTIHHEGATR